MRLEYDGLFFEGDIDELLTVIELSKAVRVTLDTGRNPELRQGESYTLDSFETWDDDDEPAS